MNDLEDINTLEITASYLKITRRQMLSLATGPTPKIGSLKSGRAYTFPREAIEAYVLRFTVDATPAHPMGLTRASARRLAQSA